jgi:hypothetical protein
MIDPHLTSDIKEAELPKSITVTMSRSIILHRCVKRIHFPNGSNIGFD